MFDWTPGEWTAFLIALGTFINTVLIAVTAFLANLAKLKSEVNSKKIDNNTQLTLAGTAAAAASARVAVDTADEVKKQLNGGLEARIKAAVAEVTATLQKELQDNSERVSRHAKANEQHRELIVQALAKINKNVEEGKQ